jgi:hypothetical protein
MTAPTTPNESKPSGPLAESLDHFRRFVTRLTTGVVRYSFDGREVLVHEVRALQIPSDNLKYPPKNLLGFFDLADPKL